MGGRKLQNIIRNRDWLYTTHICKFQKYRCNTFVCRAYTICSKSPGDGDMGQCVMTKINRGQYFTYSDNMYEFKMCMCNVVSSIVYTKSGWTH